MKIAIIGASGFIGSGLLAEALKRGHQVTALVGHPEKIAAHENLRAEKVDALDTAGLTQALKGHDAVISAFSGHAQEDVYNYYLKGFQSIVTATKAAAVARFLIVGGAGSLEVAPGKLVIDTPNFPEEYKPTALGAQEALNQLRQESDLNWTMLSPAAVIYPGESRGTFRLGTDQLVVDSDGKSEISVADYAIAMLDELENAQHIRQRFTLAY